MPIGICGVWNVKLHLISGVQVVGSPFFLMFSVFVLCTLYLSRCCCLYCLVWDVYSFYLFWFDSKGCPGQLMRASTNLIPGLVKGRPPHQDQGIHKNYLIAASNLGQFCGEQTNQPTNLTNLWGQYGLLCFCCIGVKGYPLPFSFW